MNSSFSTQLPTLQLAWDSTSVGALKECPRKYYYSIVLGYVPRSESVHLTFGLLYHAALERYDHAKATGADHESATLAAVRYCMEATWDRKLSRPWISDDKNKNRFTLVRTVVWYLEQFASDPVQTVILDNGKPAVELSFRMQLEYQSLTGEPYLLCGHFDRLGIFNDHVYVLDRKTTKNALSQDYFDKYSPDNQFSTYIFAGKVVYKQPIRGLIVDAAQIIVTLSRFQRGVVPRTDSQLDEWYKDIGIVLKHAEGYAEQRYWPMNDKACGNYGGCPYREVCSKSPNIRQQWLKSLYVQRTWDPLQVRGDI